MTDEAQSREVVARDAAIQVPGQVCAMIGALPGSSIHTALAEAELALRNLPIATPPQPSAGAEVERHPLSDQQIATWWPDMDTPEGRADIRRQFDALMAKCASEPFRGFPRHPDAMAPVLAAEARLPEQRIAALTAALRAVPEHLCEQEWFAGKPAFGEAYVYGDDGFGTGRQAIASAPGGKAFNLAPFIAAASPRNVGALLSTLAANPPAAEGEEVKRQWTCFHCDETFTDPACARKHFGPNEDSVAACVIKAGAERGLVGALRDAEEDAAKAWAAIADETTDAAKAYYAQATRHRQQIINAEEAGYERGLEDGRALSADGENASHG